MAGQDLTALSDGAFVTAAYQAAQAPETGGHELALLLGMAIGRLHNLTLQPEADRVLARAVLLFYQPEWTDEARREWRQLTGQNEATTRALGDLARAALRE